MYISIEIGQNLMEWRELPEIGWNLTQGGTGGITILDCMPIRNRTKLITLIISKANHSYYCLAQSKLKFKRVLDSRRQ